MKIISSPLLQSVNFILLFFICLIFFTGSAHAQTNGSTNAQTVKTVSESGPAKLQSLSGLQGLGEDQEDASLSGYINILFTLFITVSTMLAVLFIAIAGVKYMATDLIGVKESAKGDIYSALIGLLLILSSVIILETINPCIVNFNILENGQGINCSVND